MKAVVVNFCGGKTSKKGNHVVVELAGVKSKDAASKIVGRKIVWTSPAGKKINGEVKKVHGNSGAVKAVMEKGLPGTALGKEISVEG